ncbi:YbaB/EbfC family nucleoid-associated protein [Candidatus Falkowbacteria bacterium]|jgi:DNA-binding protein YbaB|nr:YbaB/EbfC family nucleoid-associated protein [Candidatus Falkowbacteria bacterium]MBT7007168.1 YbaB/EbfC family nucleoid-associated protein [Candidatus Falkowbacteria bacterium]
MFDKLKMMNQARELQKKMKDIVIDVESNGLKIQINGKQEINSVEIVDETLLDRKESLENSIMNAVNDANSKAQREMAMKMQGEMGGLF